MPKKSELTGEQRAQLVLRLLSKEEPATQIARRAGISEQTLYRWREEFITAGTHALNGRAGEGGRGVRRHRVLAALGIARSVWYARPAREPRKPGRRPKSVSEELVTEVKALAHRYPWWGYKRIAVVARRAGLGLSNKDVYQVFKAAGLLQKRRGGGEGAQ